jgi:muconolactone delta-isomerase
MRFLVTTLPRHPIPPEIGLGLVQAMRAFSAKYQDKMVESWAFAGLAGGGALVEVDSHDELDKMMTEFPFGPFSEVEVRALTDLTSSLDNAARQFEAWAQGMPH